MKNIVKYIDYQTFINYVNSYVKRLNNDITIKVVSKRSDEFIIIEYDVMTKNKYNNIITKKINCDIFNNFDKNIKYIKAIAINHAYDIVKQIEFEDLEYRYNKMFYKEVDKLN